MTSNTTSWRHYEVLKLRTRRYQGHELHFVSSEVDFKSMSCGTFGWMLHLSGGNYIFHCSMDFDFLAMWLKNYSAVKNVISTTEKDNNHHQKFNIHHQTRV